MLSMRIGSLSAKTASSARLFSISSARYNNPLPSTPEMKSDKSWIQSSEETNSKADIARDVVGLARSIQESTQPPLEINSQFTRRFTFGESYDPFDFSNNKLDMERKQHFAKNKKVTDPFERTGINPRTLYLMPEILSRFLTSTGQILPRSITGCSAQNQKHLSDAIRTARCCGLLSATHKHSRYLPSRNL
ncbi:ribosomal protein S18 [Scheffersomyces xylosifermentans]|uniref:ribosomal protein S18 n=1 Tax=Scheffersomyces xylosifermentans TaxID=1304137 RepID=UPI00315D2536